MVQDKRTAEDPQLDLEKLRVDIDRIDENVHRLLMERGEIIDRLIAVKARQGGGSAFRPGREAAMMRRLAERHRGLLPFDTVEGIWRIIISTFTYVQSNYSVHVDASGGDPAMRDSARFHFGYTVPYKPHHGPGATIAAVAASGGDLGMVRLDSGIGAGAWWNQLAGEGAPKIIARLPFVERPDHPAGLPVFVISHPLAEAAARDVLVYAVALDRWRDAYRANLELIRGEILAIAGTEQGLSLLVAVPGELGPAALSEAFEKAGAIYPRISEIGGHAARFDIADRA